jgi:hypothetical protein
LKKSSSKAETGDKAAGSASQDVDPMTKSLQVCELSANELSKLPVDQKQQAFYALLVKGELMLKAKGEDSETRAIGYFLKAVLIVPNPSEVVMAYEQTLPASVFQKVMDALKAESENKTSAYFAAIVPESGLMRFEERDGPLLAASGKSVGRHWIPVATKDIPVGACIMSEDADVALALPPASASVCDFCFQTIEEEQVYVADLRYCSKHCSQQAGSFYARYLERLEGTAAYAYQQLVKVVQETRCYAPLLVLRYVGMLLTDELSRQQAKDLERPGLFTHYDHLRPAYRAAKDADRAEAVLIRTILEPSNADVGEFLTDEIYVAIKSTLMFNCIGFRLQQTDDEIPLTELRERTASRDDGETLAAASKTTSDASEKAADASSEKATDTSSEKITGTPSEKGLREAVRFAGLSNQSSAIGLYHTLSHVSHSCQPNCTLQSDAQYPRRLKLVACQNVQAGDSLTISYVPDAPKDERIEVIRRDFHIICQCPACE